MATENSTAKSGKSPPPAALVKKRLKNVEYEYRYLKTVHSLEKLDDLCFKNYCKFADVKRRPKFMSLILHCTRREKKRGMCQFSLMAKGASKFHVYTHSQHNHTVKSEAERNAHQVPRGELVPDANPPTNLTTPDSRQWTLLGTAKNPKEIDQFVKNHHCQRRGEKIYGKRNRISIQCNSRKCKFLLLARKTDAQRYHMYAHGRHTGTCRYADDKISANSVKANNDEEEKVSDEEEGRTDDEEGMDEDEEGMDDDEEESGDEVLEITAEDAGPSTSSGHIQQEEWTIEEIQRRLTKALLDGNVVQVNKWMTRTGPGRIGALLHALSFVEIVKLLEMAKQQIREGRRNENMSDWLAWVQTALRAHHLELTQLVNMVDDLQGMVQGTTSSAAAQQNC